MGLIKECVPGLTYVGRGKVPAVVRQLYLYGMNVYIERLCHSTMRNHLLASFVTVSIARVFSRSSSLNTSQSLTLS